MDKAAREAFEEELYVLRCRMGDSSGFVRLFERYRGPILYYVRKMLGDADSAEDVSQEVWLKAFRGIRQLRDDGRFRPWLYCVARNEVLQALRRRRRPIDLAAEDEEAPANEPDQPYRPEDMKAINSALARLNARHREALILYFLHDMSYEEIAEATECGVGTVRSRLHYAKKALRKEMEVEHNDVPK